jgi:hypothetical protein
MLLLFIAENPATVIFGFDYIKSGLVQKDHINLGRSFLAYRYITIWQKSFTTADLIQSAVNNVFSGVSPFLRTAKIPSKFAF